MSAGYMRQCTGKNRHPEKSGAVAHRSSLAAAHNRPVSRYRVYSCPQCLGWHVGGAKTVMKTRRRNGKRANKRMRGRV